jgi:rhamnosyltransferase
MNQVRSTQVCAVVVTYHPDGDFSKRLGAVLPQVAHVIIVDNGSGAEAISRLTDLAQDSRVTLLKNERNRGLAIALNQGLLEAKRLGFSWALTLDHDTLVAQDCISNLLKTLNHHPENSKVAVIGCNYQNRTTGEYCRDPHQPRSFDEVRTLITSGSLMSLEIFEAVGPFREEFFIDGLDFEYCARARQMGFKIVMSLAVGMVHNEGEKTRHRLLGMTFVTHNHSPLRRYYIFRNGLRLILEFGLKDPKWALGLCRNLFRETRSIILFESQKFAKLKASSRGLVHGLFRRLGPHGEKWQA